MCRVKPLPFEAAPSTFYFIPRDPFHSRDQYPCLPTSTGKLRRKNFHRLDRLDLAKNRTFPGAREAHSGRRNARSGALRKQNNTEQSVRKET
jgi:hypothetical protein